MMNSRFNNKPRTEADLDVTPFMNLMIVLVPVMLLSMTFTQITVHEIKLPDLTQSQSSAEQTPPTLEVLLGDKDIKVFYPSNVLISTIALTGADDNKTYDFKQLSRVLQSVKAQLSDKRDILLLSQNNIDYQSLISAMDAVKSYKTVVAASVVDVELFPEISLANASVK